LEACEGRRVRGAHHKSHIAHHTSNIAHHTSHITHHTSHITHRTSHIAHRTSHIAHRTSHIALCTSHITHRTSHIAHRTSHITRYALHTIASHVDRVSIRGHLRSRKILRKTLGKKNIAAVQYTKASKTNAKATKRQRDKSETEVEKDSRANLFPLPLHASAISRMPLTKRKQKAPPGNGDRIPLEQKTFCVHCCHWIVTYKFAQHERSKVHTRSLSTGVKYFWCPTCRTGVLETERQSHTCKVPSDVPSDEAEEEWNIVT
jgi:hypothetical protein